MLLVVKYIHLNNVVSSFIDEDISIPAVDVRIGFQLQLYIHIRDLYSFNTQSCRVQSVRILFIRIRMRNPIKQYSAVNIPNQYRK